MQGAELVAVAVGVIGALAGVYFKELLREALERRQIAVRIKAYIEVATSELLRTEAGLSLLALAKLRSEKLRDALERRDLSAIRQILATFDHSPNRIEELLKDEEEALHHVATEIKNRPAGSVSLSLAQLGWFRTRLETGEVFTTDAESSLLAPAFARLAIEVRLGFVSALVSLESFLRYCRQDQEPDPGDLRAKLAGLLSEMLAVAMKLDPLQRYAAAVAARTPLAEVIRGRR